MPDLPTVYLIDGSGYIFRAYFAVRHLSNSKGLPTNAVFGFTTMLLKILRDRQPEFIAVTFDTGAKTFRHKMYPDYKANRPPPPEDLLPQFDLIHQVVRALAIPALAVEGYEADDLLGSLARQAVEAGHPAHILTGDKDLMQLVDDNITLYDGMKDKHIGRQQVIDKFGVPPEQVVDLLALAGDSSDNVPGVQGIGEKTAAQLIKDYGDLEAILAAAPGIKQKMRRERLIEQVEQARLSKRLVTIDRHAPIELNLDAMRYTGPDLTLSRALFTELDFHKLLREPPFVEASAAAEPMAAPDDSAPQPAASSVDRSAYRSVTQIDDLQKVVQACRAAGRCALDTETDGLDPMQARLVGLSLAWGEGEAVYVPCAHQLDLGKTQLSVEQLRDVLDPMLADPELRIVAQNGKFDRHVLRNHGFVDFAIDSDPMLASYVLDPGESSHGLDALAQRLLGHQNLKYKDLCGTGKNARLFSQVPVDQATPYAAEDADVALRLDRLLQAQLQAEPALATLYEELEIPLARVLGDIEATGVCIDTERLAHMAGEMQTDLNAIVQRAHELAGHDFNLASPRQLATILFEELQLPVVKKTKTGPSTDASVLEKLAPQHPLPAVLLEHRLLAKLKNTYIDVLPRLVHPRTGRVHTRYNQAVAATGRLSSSDPNLQNIPVRSVQGRRIREAFVAPPGRTLISADYSQIELRVLAHASQDPMLLRSFARGEDVHARTASELFGVDIDKVDPEHRRQAKAINFGLLYGMGAFRLAGELGIANKEAKALLEAYFDRYAGIKTWHQATVEHARKDGYVATLWGRRRLLPELVSKNHMVRTQAERMAINTPIQGSAADIIKRAMLRAAHMLPHQAPSARVIMQVHDELVVEVDSGQVDAARQALVEAMQGAAQLDVPLLVDVGTGQSWAEAH